MSDRAALLERLEAYAKSLDWQQACIAADIRAALALLRAEPAQGEEYIIVAERESGDTIVRAGFQTAREAALVRDEIERRINDDDDSSPYVNYVIRYRPARTAQPTLGDA